MVTTHTHTHARAHIHIHKQFCLLCSSTFSCLEQTGIGPDQSGSEGIRMESGERDKSYIHLSDCVPSLFWHIEFSVSAFGAFFSFFFKFFWTSHLSLGLENWTFEDWTGPDRLVQRAYEREKRLKTDQSDWRKTKMSHSVHMTEFIKMIASTLLSCFCFHPSKKPLDAKISHLCCGFDWEELGSSICIHLVHFIGPSYHILLNIYLFIIVCVFLLWICQCQILSLGTEVLGLFRPNQTLLGVMMCPIHSHVGSLFTLWRRKRDASQWIGWSDREELSNPAMREEQEIKLNLQMGKPPHNIRQTCSIFCNA